MARGLRRLGRWRSSFLMKNDMEVYFSFSSERRNKDDPRIRYVIYVYFDGHVYRKRSKNRLRLLEYLRNEEYIKSKPSASNTGKSHGLKKYNLKQTNYEKIIQIIREGCPGRGLLSR